MSKSQLVEMMLKLAGKRYNYEFLLVNYIDREGGELQLFEEATEELELIFGKTFRGRTVQHQHVKMLLACVKRIDEFTVETKSRKLEADLILIVLRHEFRESADLFGAKSSGFDFKVGLLLKRVITLITTKIHPDYIADYADEINDMLQKIHATSDRVNTIKQLPYTLEG